MEDRKTENSLVLRGSNDLNDNRNNRIEADEVGETVREEEIVLMDDICEIVQDLIPLYVEDLVSLTSKKLIEEHVKNCPDCAKQLEEARHSLDVLPTEEDQKMESALKKVNRKFYHHWLMLVGLGVLCAALLIPGGILFQRYIQVSADEISVELTSSSSDEKTLKITSMYGPLFGLKVQERPYGEYAVSAYRWKEEKKSEKTTVLLDPVHSIYFNQELVWQDGVTISPRCRELFVYVNGYAGSTEQMQLARPQFPEMEYYIEADTENKDHCTWTYFPLSGNNSEIPDQIMEQAWNKNALLALVLTPNLQKICLARSKDQMLLEVDRGDLKNILDEAHLSEDIDSLRDLQLIMNTVLGPAG